MLFLNVVGLLKSLLIQNINYKIKFDFTSMISREKFGIRTEYFNENYLAAVKRARIIGVVFSAQDSVQGFVAWLEKIIF